MEQPVPVKEVKILETAEDIQERREQVSCLIQERVISKYLPSNFCPGPQQVFRVQSCS